MPISPIQGIGSALGAFANQVADTRQQNETERRRRAIEDEQRARQAEAYGMQKQSWQEGQQVQQAQAMGGAAKLDALANKDFDPIDAAWKHVQTLEQGGQTTQPQAPQVSNPNPAAGPTVTTGLAPSSLADRVGGQQPMQQTPDSTAPLPPELIGIRDRYQRYEDQAAQAKKRISDYVDQNYKGDPAAKERMLAAWMDNLERQPDYQKVKSDLEGYVDNAQKQFVAKRANVFVDAVQRNDTKAIESMYGPGARAGADPRTGLQGVILPDRTFVGGDVVLARAMMKSGLMDAKEFAKISTDSANNIAKLLAEKERDRNSLRLEYAKDARNKDIEKAQRVGELTLQLDKVTDPAKRKALQAEIDVLNVGVTNAQTKAAQNAALDSLRGDKQTYDRVDRAIKSAAVWNNDEGKLIPKITGKQAVEQFKQLNKVDPSAAIAYASGLPTELNGPVQDYIRTLAKPEDAGDVGGNRPRPDQPKTSQGLKKNPTTVQKDGKTYYLWSDGKYHSRGPENS